MAAFSPVAVEGLVLLACVEWWKTAHTVVIRVDQAHLKHESRSRSRNSQLDPQGTPTALSIYAVTGHGPHKTSVLCIV